MSMSEAVIVALITAGFPTLTTAITAIFQSRETKKNAAKSAILQMILEDHVANNEGHLPTNYQNVLQEFDKYTKNGGNTYLKKKVDEYIVWFDAIEKGKQHGKMA